MVKRNTIIAIAGLAGVGALAFYLSTQKPPTNGNGNGAPSVSLQKTTAKPNEEVGFVVSGFESFESFAVLFGGEQISEGATDVNGEFSGSFIVPGDADIGSHIVKIDGEVNSTSHIILIEEVEPEPEPEPEEITPNNYPWGANIQNLGLNIDVDIFEERNDIRFDIVQTGLEDKMYYLIRSFDPNGVHVKDYVSTLSDTDPRDFDHIGARINNVAGSGTWRFFIFVSDEFIPEDSSKPLEFGDYTAITEGTTMQFIEEQTFSI